jgi:hypothetical protein
MKEYEKLYSQLNIDFYMDLIPLSAKFEELPNFLT